VGEIIKGRIALEDNMEGIRGDEEAIQKHLINSLET
jgi:hypothetical protein